MPANIAVNSEFLSNGGEMGKLIRSINWEQTPIGPVDEWPQSLRTSVSLCLNSRFPILIWWGKELVMIYNDAYRPMLGTKHPWSMGCPGQQVWPEIWPIIGPMLQTVTTKGEATWSEDQLLLLERYGYPEECYFTYSYSPIHDELGIGGVFCAVTETTDKVIGARQMKTLKDLGKTASQIKTVEEVFAKTIKVLKDNNKDFPFALLYQVDENGTQAQLVQSTETRQNHKFPQIIDLTENSFLSATFAQAMETQQLTLVKNDENLMGHLPKGFWKQSSDKILIQPIVQSGKKLPYALLVTALNPHRLLNTNYESFSQLVADQIATDIADVIAYEEERKRAEALEEIDKAKTIFFNNISHEFRTPLTLMLGPLEELLNRQKTQLNHEQFNSIETSHRNAQRLLKLVNTLLDFSRLEAGRVQTQMQPIDLPTLTAGIASNFRPIVEKAGLELIIDCQSLPQPVYVDKEMWEKILLNLLSNAFKYTLQGSIAVQLSQQNGHVQLVVQDTGVGIPPEELPNIFKRFYRVSNTKGRTYEGTGIGLSLVQELVKLHEGTITVSSQLSKGTTFTVTIPVAPADAPAIAYAPTETITDHTPLFTQEAKQLLLATPSDDNKNQQASKDVSENGQQKPYILFADDNADMRNYVQHLLEVSFTIKVVPDGQAALESIRQVKPDLVLTDAMMPNLNGFELLKAIKENSFTSNIPVILLSARAGEEATVDGLGAGADDYLIKPFSSKELVSRINTHLKIAKTKNKAEQELYNLFMQAPVAICILKGPQLTVELANAPLLKIWGKEASIIGKPLLEALPEVKDLHYPQLLQQVMETGATSYAKESFAYLVREGKPEPIYFNFVYQPLREIDGTISGVLVVANEVTEQVEARRKVEESEQRFRMVADTAPVMIWMAGTDQRCNFFNKGWLEYTGRSMEQEVGYGWTASVHPDDVAHCIQVFTASFKAHKNFQMEFRLKRYDGEYHWVYNSAVPRYATDGTFEGYIGSCMDIQDKKLAAEALEKEVENRTKDLTQANNQLEASNRELEQFAYAASHDMQEPLRKIQTFASFLSENGSDQLSESSKKFISKIQESAKRMSVIIDDLLNYSHQTNTDKQFAETDLNKIITDVTSDLELLIQQKGATIRCEKIPVIEAVPLQMHQLFYNLINNSLKFSKPDVPTEIKISVETVEENKATENSSRVPVPFIRIKVQDNGIGFDQQYANKIFELFQRLNDRYSYGGTGIGLALCKKIVSNHKGAISAQSVPDQGATFFIELPIHHHTS